MSQYKREPSPGEEVPICDQCGGPVDHPATDRTVARRGERDPVLLAVAVICTVLCAASIAVATYLR